ncbi:uncharacterized protein LOC124261423 [Haliotis rubra]|uniref:uncharacterized protein LOC124261423 n=1 Tax=Haliotis rubra TaxID=36100 RepID=UPI001EE50AA9|nr:uncharacterized protein LOC124261423 [Haliotis rubra]
MPVSGVRGGKSMGNSRQKKEDVAEKVREMKLRQQNWMKQRDEHLTKPETEAPKTKSGKESTSNDRSGAKKASAAATQSMLSRTQSAEGRLNTRPSKPFSANGGGPSQVNTRGKFQNWLQVRHNSSDVALETADSSVREEDEGTVDLDGASAYIQRGTSAPVCQQRDDFSDFSEGEFEELKSRLLAPTDFDALADRIVSRVKKDLDLNGTDRQYKTSSYQSKRHVSSELPLENEDSSSNMSSHHCPCCSEIMIGSQFTPLLLIPCGHTVCRECSQGRELCPECYCSIGSTTCNIMLQQIIQEYQGKKTMQKISRSQTYRKDDQYSPQNYQEHKKGTHPSVDNNHYKEQLQNLCTRLDVLSSEKTSAQVECERLSDAIQREAVQVRNISKEEDNICSQIDTLGEKLNILRQHRGGVMRE